MKSRDFKKILKEERPQKIIEKYMLSKIYLTEKQLEKVCDLGEHHAGTCFGRNNEKVRRSNKI